MNAYIKDHDYDVENDVLYAGVCKNWMANAYGDETDDGIVMFYDADTNDWKGILVYSPKRFMRKRTEALKRHGVEMNLSDYL